ncbi:hypothetical protein ACFSFY_10295 [Sporosarcina siberiensis]|uniref:Uncharacterized protein n=1 Tax=Sporosarcina siberiensis TaxID=1365606 RepID=A0ABW4SHD1_9BACL
MSLFMNEREHPGVYQNSVNRIEPNQNSFKSDVVTELLKEQKSENDNLQHYLRKLEKDMKKTEQRLLRQSDRIGNQFDKLEDLDYRHEVFESNTSTWIEKINIENKVQQDVLSNSLLLEEDLASKIDEQSNTQKMIVKQQEEQEVELVEIGKRLVNQEALLEKVLRQIDYYRSILFERTQLFAGKIEQGYTNSTSYVSRLVKGENKNVKDAEDI